MGFDSVISIFTVFFLDAAAGSEWYLYAFRILFLFGMWGIFKKCGLTPWHALIPCLREIKLGEAVGLEKEGRIAAVLRGIIVLLSELQLFFAGRTENALDFFSFVNLFVALLQAIYLIKLYLALCDIFDRKKRWIILWVILEFIPAVLWGWMKKYQPLWTASEMKSDAASFFSGSKAAVLDQGLTINLEERTATEFFKKKYLLRDIHMYIQPGHMVLLLGGSGAGKTTYLNAVNGYEKAKAEVVLNGRNMYKEYKDMQYDIGFVPQQDLMRGSDTVLRTLMDAAILRLPSTFTHE